MICQVHGELPADWTSCPYCLRDSQHGRGVPPAPTPLSTRVGPGATAGGPGGYGREPNSDVTRGAPGYGQPGAADVTRGAEALSGRGYGNPGATRIIDPPPSALPKIRAWLIQKEGPRPDQVSRIKDDVTWIGRDQRNDIFIDDDTVSGQHAKLWVDDQHVLRLLNVSTSNGTQVNGARVEAPVELEENDEIKIGVAVLVLKRIDAPIRATPVTPSAASATEPRGTSSLTAEAQDLLSSVDSGGVPAYRTPNLDRIARENDVEISPDMTPDQIIERLRQKSGKD